VKYKARTVILKEYMEMNENFGQAIAMVIILIRKYEQGDEAKILGYIAWGSSVESRPAIWSHNGFILASIERTTKSRY
jgi:hypothetical protein